MGYLEEFDGYISDVKYRQYSPGSRQSATKLLIEIMEKSSQGVRANKIIKLAGDKGISLRTLRRVKAELGIDSFRKFNKWYWRPGPHFRKPRQSSNNLEDYIFSIKNRLTGQKLSIQVEFDREKDLDIMKVNSLFGVIESFFTEDEVYVREFKNYRNKKLKFELNEVKRSEAIVEIPFDEYYKHRKKHKRIEPVDNIGDIIKPASEY